MPGVSSNGFDPEEFAKLMARFDTGNPSEAEAMNAGRAMRRMVAGNGLRLVDVIERADVKQALDLQLQPVREDSPELKAAFLEIARLADLATQREGIIEELRQKVGAGAGAGNQVRRPRASERGLINGGLVAVVTLAVIAMLVAAAIR
jgi:hypothetical protein